MNEQDDNPYASPRETDRTHADAESTPDARRSERRSTVHVASYQYVVEATLVQGMLAQEGIDAWLEDENVVQNFALWSNAVGGVKLVVAEEHAERAVELLKAYEQQHESRQPSEEIEFDCEECGARIKFAGKRRGCVETCPKCGEYVDVPE